MKKTITLSFALMFALLIVPNVLLAQEPPIQQGLPPIIVEANRDRTAPTTPDDGDTFQEIVANVVVRGADFIIVFLVGLTVLVFMFGLAKYMFKGANSDTARTEGRKLMLWGLIGIFVMVSVWGLVGVLSATIGHQSRGVPQFQPNGTFADGRARTSNQRVYSEAVTAARNTRERFTEILLRELGNVPQNVRQGGRNFVNFMQSIPGRVNGN